MMRKDSRPTNGDSEEPATVEDPWDKMSPEERRKIVEKVAGQQATQQIQERERRGCTAIYIYLGISLLAIVLGKSCAH